MLKKKGKKKKGSNIKVREWAKIYSELPFAIQCFLIPHQSHNSPSQPAVTHLKFQSKKCKQDIG